MANATQADIAVQTKRLTALDVQRAAYLALPAKQRDNNGLLDILQAAVRARSEINRLSGPAGRD